MEKDKKETVAEKFESFFANTSKVVNYVNGSNSASRKVKLRNSVPDDLVPVNRRLLFDFEQNEFGQKCIKMMLKYNCEYSFNPESEENPGKVNGVFSNSGDNYNIDSYVEDPLKVLSNMTHEGTHLMQRVRMKKAFEGLKSYDLDYDQYMMTNMVFEADAFSNQIEQAYFDKRRPEIFKNMKEKNISKPLVDAYEDTYIKTGDKNEAYKASFEAFFTSHSKEEFYSSYYTNQYIKAKAYMRPHKRINIGKFTRAVTNGRYVDGDKVESLVLNDFRVSHKDWLRMNSRCCQNTNFNNKQTGFNSDKSYMKFKTYNYSRYKEFEAIDQALDYLTKHSHIDENTPRAMNLRNSRERFKRNLSFYKDNRLIPHKGGSYQRALREWIYLERLYAKSTKNQSRIVVINEAKRIHDTIDSRKPYGNTDFVYVTQRAKERKLNKKYDVSVLPKNNMMASVSR